MAQELVVLEGGSRAGASTLVDEGVRRILTPSEAPGLLEVYEADGRTRELPGNDEDALVFVLVGQQSADGVAPELLHAPGTD